jgi:predicted permease
VIRLLLARIRGAFGFGHPESHLRDEVRVHLELLARDHERRGMAPSEARLAARRDFGGIEQMKEIYRDRRGLPWMDDARRDVQHVLRALRRAPVFAAAAVLTLAVGLTAVTAIFAILNAFMFRPMPVSHPEQLVSIGTGPDSHVQIPHGISFPDLQDYRERQESFSDLLGYQVGVGALNIGNATERVTTYEVTDNYFSMLGVEPALGRLIQPGEGKARGDAPVLVLTHEFWLARFGGNPSVVGRGVRLNGRPFTIIGVTPQSFDGAHSLIRPSAYVPLWMHDDLMNNPATESILESRASHQNWVLGRLNPGVTLSQARAALQVTAAALAREYPATNKDASLVVIPETHARPNPNIGPMFRVAGMAFAMLAVILLLITSANVTNLLMARAITREREVALRAALGAGRGRLVRQLLTESVVLAMLAGAATLPVVVLALRRLERETAASTALATLRPDFSLDLSVLAAALMLTLVAGIVSGLAPALMATRSGLNVALRAGGRGAGESRARFRSALVVAQVALSLMLLVSGGLFVRSLDRARQVELGFDPDNVLVATAVPGETGYDSEQRRAYYTQVRERILRMAGVERAAWTQWAPLATISDSARVWLESRPPRADEQAPVAASALVDPGYFAVAHIPILEGRSFEDRDNEDAKPVAIVNQTLARQLWPNQTPVGRSVVVDGGPVEVVGVAPNGKYFFIWEPPRPMVFRPLAQSVPDRATLVVRSTRASAELASEVRRAFRDVDPAVFVFDVRTMDEHLVREGGGLMAFELGAMVATVFGSAGVLLAAIGLYGMIAGRVSQRTHEIGVRIALGAGSSDILRDVLFRGARLALLGIAGGAILAAFVAQGLRTLLFDISPFDPLTYVAVSLFLIGVSLLASFVPARRAASVDPVIALRAE